MSILFKPGHRWHGKKLEDLPSYYLIVMSGFASLVSTVTGLLVMLFIKNRLLVAHDGATLSDVVRFSWHAVLAAALGMELLFCLLLASRTIKVLGERWFP